MDTESSAAPPSVPASALAARFGQRDAPWLIDVRRAAAYDADHMLIAGALRLAPESVESAIDHLPRDRDLVVYCVHGHGVSQGAARILIAAGLRARFLEGGFAAWTDAGLPTMIRRPEAGIPACPGQPSRWVTRERPKIDRVACPWLIRRFLDPTAEFLYVPAPSVMATSLADGAVPYDVPDVRFTHRCADGERCSFDAFVDDFELTDASLGDLATIVRGADIGKPDLTPQSPGLLAVSLGLSVNFADDHAMLEQSMPLYDALYAWARSARAEIHNADLFKKA